jgi:hypothetical protein
VGISSPDRTPSSVTEHHPGDRRDKNIIALGGPVNNTIAERVLNPERHLGLEFYLDTDRNRVLSNDHVVHDPPGPNPKERMEDSESGLFCHIRTTATSSFRSPAAGVRGRSGASNWLNRAKAGNVNEGHGCFRRPLVTCTIVISVIPSYGLL